MPSSAGAPFERSPPFQLATPRRSAGSVIVESVFSWPSIGSSPQQESAGATTRAGREQAVDRPDASHGGPARNSRPRSSPWIALGRGNWWVVVGLSSLRSDRADRGPGTSCPSNPAQPQQMCAWAGSLAPTQWRRQVQLLSTTTLIVGLAPWLAAWWLGPYGGRQPTSL